MTEENKMLNPSNIRAWDNLDSTFFEKLKNLDLSFFEGLNRPEWMNDNGYKRMSDMSLLKGETVVQCYARMAIDYGGDHEQTFKRLYNREFNFSTSACRNAGSCRQYASCFLGKASNDYPVFANQMCGWTKILSNGSAIGVGFGTYPSITHEITPLKKSTGLLQQMKMFNETLNSISTRDNKRADGAIYTDIYHQDVYKCLQVLDPNHHNHLSKVMFGLMVRDNFMRACFNNEIYHLFGSRETLETLSELYGNEFEEKYNEFVRDGKYSMTIDANELMRYIVQGIMASGRVYIVHKDTVNHMSNQKNIGTVTTSNLCVEIMQYTSDDTMGICTLGTMCLPTFVKEGDNGKKYFDFEGFRESVEYLTGILDRMIDQPYNLTIAENGAKHRALGIGYSGLYDAQMMLGLYDRKSRDFHEFNLRISEHLYYAALSKSVDLAIDLGPYEKFWGSPASMGKLQFDLYREWEEKMEGKGGLPNEFSLRKLNVHEKLDPSLDWNYLKKRIVKHGLRNSLLTTAMPTAGSSIIQNVNESFENIYSHIQNIGTDTTGFIRFNKYIYDVLKDVDKNVINSWLLKNHGNTFKDATFCTDEDRLKLKTVFDDDFTNEVLLAATRQRFICQSQSFNLYVSQDQFNSSMGEELASLLIYGWRLGVKTGCYYFRPLMTLKKNNFGYDEEEPMSAYNYPSCSRENKECTACSV